MAKFHNTPEGPKPCTATKKACPVGGQHYTDAAEAQVAYEKELNTTYGALPTSSKTKQGSNTLEKKFTAHEVEEFSTVMKDPEYWSEHGYPTLFMVNKPFEEKYENDPRFKEFVDDALKQVRLPEGNRPLTEDDVIAFANRTSVAARLNEDDGGMADEDIDNPEAAEAFLKSQLKENPAMFTEINVHGKEFILVTEDYS